MLQSVATVEKGSERSATGIELGGKWRGYPLRSRLGEWGRGDETPPPGSGVKLMNLVHFKLAEHFYWKDGSSISGANESTPL